MEEKTHTDMMPIKEQSSFYKLKMLRNRARYGLLLLTIRNVLTRIGLDFEPYWIEREGLDCCNEPELKDVKEFYTLKIVDDSLIREQFRILAWNTAELESILSSDHYSFGLFRQDQIAAIMIAFINEYTFKKQHLTLGPHEAYLANMYTYENFRGKNLAPYLRYKCYEMLAKEGKTTCYSVTQYFNSSSLKFKAKLGARHQELYLHVGLFNKFRKTFLLKRYPAALT